MPPVIGVLAPSSPRYRDWLRVFGTDRVELEDAVGVHATVPGRVGLTRVFKLKMSALTLEQHERLAHSLAANFNVPHTEVLLELAGSHGCPILADDITLQYASPIQ